MDTDSETYQPFAYEQVRLALSYVPHRVSHVRMVVSAQLADGLYQLNSEALLIVTELCSNVQHASDPRFELRMQRTLDGVRFEVRDASLTLPPVPAGSHDVWVENGRGLRLIHAFSTRCGSQQVQGGKVVWAECGSTSAK